ncbi:rRNA-binding ribosome biosynthesis protein UTP23 [Sporobolomyces salmoneus]|uniref:rRNA-binding ribosome biosynthesis protein UTP23 n=1 Tax=Sporobolomyces salmoneus TaxID=183962 RepID=UPI00317FF2F4
MRQKRVKSYRKVMQLYCAAFGFREPYQLLVDAAFLRSCVQQKLDFYARLQDVLQGTVKPMITQCCIQALYDQGEEGQAAVEMAKEFERRKCNHFKPRPEDECMTAMAGEDNKNRYVIATQSTELRQTLRKVPGTPIIYIARSVVLLETPSDQTLAKKQSMENSKLHASKEELALLSGKPLPKPSTSDEENDEEREAGEGAGGDEPPKKKRKQRGPKGPNPLSVPKKKKTTNPPQNAVQAGKKRAREELESEQKERKRKREENEKVVVTSLAGRGTERASIGDGSTGAEGKKKRKRRKKTKAGEGGGGEAGSGGE